MANSNISNVASKLSPAQIDGDAGLINIRYHAQIEAKPNGQKKIGGSRPAFFMVTRQIVRDGYVLRAFDRPRFQTW